MQIISLSSLIEASHNEEEIDQYLSTFKCEKNKEVQLFLHEKAKEYEKRSFTRTSLVLDDDNGNEIIGYFTLLVKPFQITEGVSKGLRKA